MGEFGWICERRMRTVDEGKSKVISCARYVNVGRMKVRLNGELLDGGRNWIVLSTWGRKRQQTEDVKEKWYAAWIRGVNVENEKSVMSNRGFEKKRKIIIWEVIIIVRMVLYGTGEWCIWEVLREGKWIFFRWSVWDVWCECHQWTELGKKMVRRSTGIERELVSLVDQRVLRWFGHAEKTAAWSYRITRRVLMAQASEVRVWGRPKLGWVDGLKVALGSWGMTVEAARQCVRDRKEWRAMVYV